ncbi:hypothetical protein [Micromonospora sp. WMMD964]|uniref:P-loop NTPase n=1 Tax=Micromonospora sp. WMMD964 TaxID=3016091 RepID=UPI00249A611B|nr:hypothetical protein [Micromonospora sp. WMMD964]WFE98611.1 hypothetical protein O7616_17015 [Micromonospora sp. WMMD964]
MEANQDLRGGMGSTNYQAVGDIRVGLDAEEAGRLIEHVADALRPRPPGSPAPLLGWVRITPQFLANRKPRADLADYFDGLAPDWKDVCHPKLRPRPAVTKVVHAFRTNDLEDRSILLRIAGATGDGKSTVLLQAVALLAQENRFDAIYWRSTADGRLGADALASMRASQRTILIASDDAEALLMDIDRFAFAKLHEEDVFIHFLLASRDVDWNGERDRLGWKFSTADRWAPSFRVLPPIQLGGVAPADARVVAENWINCSSSRPARLASNNIGKIAEGMLDASRASEGRQAFMGALLSMRFDSERLRPRLLSLLSRLATVRPGDPGISLAEFLVVLATVDVSGIEGMPRDIAARLLDIPESELRPSVEVPMKREFSLGASSRAFFARHPSISKAMLELALSDESDLRVESSLEKFIGDVREAGEQSGFRPGFGQLIDLGRRLMNSGLPRELVAPLALHLCRIACTVEPRELSNFIALSQALRELGRPQAAITEVWEGQATRLDDRSVWGDYANHVRGAWTELSTTLGTSGNQWPSYWAAQVSISDRPASGIDSRNVPIALNQLALNAKLVCEQGAERRDYLDLLVEVEALTSAPGSALFDGKRYPTRYLQQLGIAPRPYGGTDALLAAIRRAAEGLRASQPSLPWCDRLASPKDDSFDTLIEHLARRVGRSGVALP